MSSIAIAVSQDVKRLKARWEYKLQATSMGIDWNSFKTYATHWQFVLHALGKIHPFAKINLRAPEPLVS